MIPQTTGPRCRNPLCGRPRKRRADNRGWTGYHGWCSVHAFEFYGIIGGTARRCCAKRPLTRSLDLGEERFIVKATPSAGSVARLVAPLPRELILCARPGCGVKVPPHHSGQKYCSQQCREINTKSRHEARVPVKPTDCARPGCGEHIERPRSRQKYCTPLCARLAYNEEAYGPQPGVRLSAATSGAVSELVAGADLLGRGYEVFRALSPSCSCDLIALRAGQTLRIEVRTGQRSRISGNLTFGKNKDAGRADHYCVVVAGGTEILYVPPLPEDPA